MMAFSIGSPPSNGRGSGRRGRGLRGPPPPPPAAAFSARLIAAAWFRTTNWPGRDAAVVGEHDVGAVLVEHVDRLALEHVAVLAEDERLRPLRGPPPPAGSDEHVVAELLDRHPKPHPLARPEPPDEERLAVLLVSAATGCRAAGRRRTCG